MGGDRRDTAVLVLGGCYQTYEIFLGWWASFAGVLDKQLGIAGQPI